MEVLILVHPILQHLDQLLLDVLDEILEQHGAQLGQVFCLNFVPVDGGICLSLRETNKFSFEDSLFITLTFAIKHLPPCAMVVAQELHDLREHLLGNDLALVQVTVGLRSPGKVLQQEDPPLLLPPEHLPEKVEEALWPGNRVIALDVAVVAGGEELLKSGIFKGW